MRRVQRLRTTKKHYVQAKSQEFNTIENNENSPMEKVQRILQEYLSRIPEQDTEIVNDIKYCLNVFQDLMRDNENRKFFDTTNQSNMQRRVPKLSILNLQASTLSLLKKQSSYKPLADISEQHESENLNDKSNNQNFMQPPPQQNSHSQSQSVFDISKIPQAALKENKNLKIDPLKLSRYLQNYNQGVINCLETIDTFEFDIFQLKKISNGKELIILGYEIAQSFGLIEGNNIERLTFLSFLQGVSQSYNNVAYHSKTHAADVLQTLHFFMKTGRMIDILQLTPLEHLGSIIAAISHDLDHPGFNNQFLVNTKDEIALLYNDQSVLENHHVAQTFLLLQQEEFDIFRSFSNSNYTKIREIMIKMVLSTDMFYHVQNFNQFKQIIENAGFNNQENISNNQILISEEEILNNKVFLMGQTLHFSDISNPCRPWKVCQRWTDLVFREFFYQGELEKSLGLQVSNLMDRNNTNIAVSQIGFITFLIEPSIIEFSKLCQELQPLSQQLAINKKNWDELKDIFEIYRSIANNEEVLNKMHIDDDYFEYNNYKERLRLQALNASQRTNSTAPQPPKKSFTTVYALRTNNQRPSILVTKRSSILLKSKQSRVTSPTYQKNSEIMEDPRDNPVFEESSLDQDSDSSIEPEQNLSGVPTKQSKTFHLSRKSYSNLKSHKHLKKDNSENMIKGYKDLQKDSPPNNTKRDIFQNEQEIQNYEIDQIINKEISNFEGQDLEDNQAIQYSKNYKNNDKKKHDEESI